MLQFQTETIPVKIDLQDILSTDGSSSAWMSFTSDTDSLTTTVASQEDLVEFSPQSSQSESPTSSQQPPLKRQKTVLFDTKKILLKTASGKNVIKHLTTCGFLSKKIRHELVSLLVAHLIDTHGKNPSAFEKSALAHSVTEAFPQLKDPDGVTGYEAFYSKGAHKCPASGYLEEHLRYVRKQMIQKEVKKVPRPAEEAAVDDTPKHPIGEDLQAKMQWMKSNSEPREQVQENMKDTFESRREWVKNTERTVAEIVDQFPRLLDEGMIEEEFRRLHPGKAFLLLTKWSSLQDTIIEYGIQQCTVWKDVLQLPIEDVKNLTEEERANLALFFLPLILEGHYKKTGGRCSADAFIDTQPDIINIPAYLDGLSTQDRPQPFVLQLYRDSILQPTTVFIIIEKQALPQASLLGAVDGCYKSHYVFDCKYQDRCKAVWNFFQTCVFGQGPHTRKDSAALRALRAYISFKKVP